MSPSLDIKNKKVLLRMPNWIGDFVMATPLIKDIKSEFPDCHLTLLLSKGFAGLVEADDLVDEVIAAPSLRGLLSNSVKQDVFSEIRSKGFDVNILTTNSFSSALQSWQSDIPLRVGFKNEFRSFFLSHPINFPHNKQKQHLVKTYKKLLSPFGIAESSTKPYLNISTQSLDDARKLLSEYGINPGEHTILGINPGAAYGSAKCWPQERFAEVAKRLSENEHTRILFFGAPEQKGMIDHICSQQNDKVINLASKTNLSQLIALIKLSDIMLSNDSGPMHLSYALETPVVAVFGSTNDTATGPYCFGRVIHKRVSCSPCYLRKCPIDFRCMRSITADEVCHTLSVFLEKHSSKRFV
ncbi:MAG: lipopolysaccharide heptosyltransferase II [Chlamydiales bacterium]|nr:lipopolysaccharide heptosyltransferase II [Chlamydiales bacterium]